VVLAVVGGARAQALVPPVAPDSGRQTSPARERHRRVVAQYDSRYSVLNHYFCVLNGLKLGVEWPGRFRAGAAIYFLSSAVPTREARPEGIPANAEADLRFRYLALYGEMVLLNTPRWELSAPLQVGMGSNYVRYTVPNGPTDKTDRRFMAVIEPSVAAQMRIFRWAGVGAGAGWRQPLLTPGAVQRELNGPVFHLRAKLFLSDLVKVVKNKERLFTQEGLRVE
jgi:hypothetical protein